MKKNLFSSYVILTVVVLTSMFLLPANGKPECDRRDLSGECIQGDSDIKMILQSEETAVQNAANGKPILILPWGQTFTTTPTYTWYAVPDATWYHLWVSTSTGTLGERWYTAAEVGCPSGTGTCSLSPGAVLAPGTYTWWIQAWYNAYGPWSDGKPFYIDPNGKNCQNISSAGFTPCNSNITYDSSWGWKWRTGGTANCFNAPVHLPAGAQITTVFLDYSDNNATYDVGFWFFNVLPTGGTSYGYGINSSGTPGYGRLQRDLIDWNIIVDNAGRTYFVRVQLYAPDSSNQFFDAIVCHKPIP